jgi:uncharacterized protein YbaA (DUF1428 family)
MARYVDGYLLAIPKKSRTAYAKMARAAAKVWKDHGALEVRECIGEDLTNRMCGMFPKLVKAKPSETIVFSWIVYPSRAVRDRVNGKVMADPRMHEIVPKEGMPFDMKRMWFGGFETIVSL